jgi:NAD+ synthase
MNARRDGPSPVAARHGLRERAQRGLQLDPAETVGALQGFLRDETHDRGFERVVLANSGGVDSALACTLAAGALGPDNVLAVWLPYRTSSPPNRADAELLVTQLGVRSRTIDITPAVDGYLDTQASGLSNIRRGNVMARVRMIAIFDQSAEFEGLVVGTSNKTELMLGYGTLFGDMACALNPLGDLFKTQVRQLAAAVGVPEPILTKPPSADLWVGQSDEGELGFSYAEADQILYLLFEEPCRAAEVIAAGYSERVVKRIAELVRSTQFKRQPPAIAKLADRVPDPGTRPPPEGGS